MKKRTFKHNLFIVSLLVLILLISTGCYELNYSDVNDYYDLFNDTVYLIYANEDGTSSSQTIKSLENDLFNDDTANNIHTVDTINEEYYEYLCIKTSAFVTVQDVALFVKTSETLKFKVNIYLADELPITSSIRSFGLEEKNPLGVSIEYSDNYDDPISSVDVVPNGEVWQSVYFNSWIVDGKETKYVDVEISKYIIVQFYNNTGYGQDAGYEPAKFSIVNLMVSPKNEKYAIETE